MRVVCWRKYVLTFLVLAVVGLIVRMYGRGVVAGLLGEGLFYPTFFIPRLFLPALAGAVAGFVLPKGFLLWGIAVVILQPIAEGLSISRALEAGVIESSQLGGLVFFEVIMLVMLMLACTVAAVLGAGLRLLWWRLRGESVRGKLGISYGSNDPV